MATIRSFRDLLVWNAAMDLVLTTYSLVAKLPTTERFELGAQLRRSAVSVASNIAEGHAGGPRLRYLNHARIAAGSLAELDTQFEIARRLNFLSPVDLTTVEQQVARTGQLLYGLIRSLRSLPGPEGARR
jgi:four helix bundle protein